MKQASGAGSWATERAGRKRLGLVVLAVALLALSLPAQGGPTLSYGPVEVVHDGSHRTLALAYLRALPRALGLVQSLIGTSPPAGTRLRIVRDWEELQLRVVEAAGSEPPRWAAGIAVGRQALIFVRADVGGPTWSRLDGLLRHELAHVALARRLSEGARVPRWFDEGVAQMAEGRVLVEGAPALGAKAFFGGLIPFDELEAAFPEGEGASTLAYTQAESFVRFLNARSLSGRGVRRIVGLCAEGMPFRSAVQAVTGLPPHENEGVWRAELDRDRSWILPELMRVLGGIGFAVVTFLGVRKIFRKRRADDAHWTAVEEGELAAQSPSTSSST